MSGAVLVIVAAIMMMVTVMVRKQDGSRSKSERTARWPMQPGGVLMEEA